MALVLELRRSQSNIYLVARSSTMHIRLIWYWDEVKLAKASMYIHMKKINHEDPKSNTIIKPITGTISFHMVWNLLAVPNILLCIDLSCSCSVCIRDQNGPCLYGKYRHTNVLWNISEGHTTSAEQICTSENNASTFILSCLYMFLY